MSIPRVLTIAGSDSGGGAGIQADIKAITAFGGHAMTAITAITAQNTRGVTDVLVLEPELVVAQIDAVLSDIGVDAIKIGMLGTAEIVHTVVDTLGELRSPLPGGGAFIVYEAIIDDDRSKNAFGLMMSLNMLIETPGGFDYTGADCIGWMKEAGFTSMRVEPLVGPDSMVIAIK